MASLFCNVPVRPLCRRCGELVPGTRNSSTTMEAGHFWTTSQPSQVAASNSNLASTEVADGG